MFEYLGLDFDAPNAVTIITGRKQFVQRGLVRDR